MKTIRDILLWSRNYLKNKGINSYLLDADVIISQIIQRDKSFIYAHPEYSIPEDVFKIIKGTVYRRGKRIPLSYLFNTKEFFGIDFYVERGVFTPRPETELLVEEVIKTVKDGYNGKEVRLYEIGLGTGAISISIALNHPNISIIGCDISKKALLVTKKNILRYNLKKRMKIIRGSDFVGVKQGSFDIIVSNPPYLSLADYREADKEVRVEPKRALMAKEKGFYLLKKIIREGMKYLKSEGGYIFLEIGDGQGDYLLKYANRYGFEANLIYDYANKERVLKLQYKAVRLS